MFTISKIFLTWNHIAGQKMSPSVFKNILRRSYFSIVLAESSYFSNLWAIMTNKGYQRLQFIQRVTHLIRKRERRVLNMSKEAFTGDVSSYSVDVESYFECICGQWSFSNASEEGIIVFILIFASLSISHLFNYYVVITGWPTLPCADQVPSLVVVAHGRFQLVDQVPCVSQIKLTLA